MSTGSLFVPGWNPARALVARTEMLASKRYCTVAPGQTIPPAFSLSQFLLRELEQLQAGTCWTHAAVCLTETLAVAHDYAAFPICRRLAAWVGKQLEGGGNPSDGGAVTDALLAMSSEKGVGIAHENLCPYTDDRRTLGTKPPDLVFVDAKASHLLLPVDVKSDDDARALIASRYPVGIGTWWPFNFDDGQTFMTSIGRGTYGHALVKIGYALPGVFPGAEGKHGWWQWRNWHGQLYPPLPPEYAACVPGYKSDHPTTTSDFWVRDDLDSWLQSKGNYEYVSATDVSGLKRNVVETDSDLVFV